jgi:hypothetical protein
MAARLEQEAKRRAEKKPASAVETTRPRSVQEIEDELCFAIFATEFKQAGSLSPHLGSSVEAQGAALWDKAVESLGRSAGVLEELAESAGETIAHIAARGDRIDRVQKETRTLLNALVDSEADA